MGNTPYKGLRLPREIQLQRVQRAIREELTPLQREVLTACYFQRRRQIDVARERGVNRSTVCRTLHRAETRLRQVLNY